MMKRFWMVMSQSIEERRQFREGMGVFLSAYYDTNSDYRFLRDWSLRFGRLFAKLRNAGGQFDFAQRLTHMGFNENQILKINKWCSDCIVEWPLESFEKISPDDYEQFWKLS